MTLPVRVLASLGASLLLSAPSLAESNHPAGQVDFAGIRGLGDPEKTIEIFLGGPLMELVAAATEEDDPAFAQTLRDLDAIRVEIYPYEDDEEVDVRRQAAGIIEQIEAQGWNKTLRVRDPDKWVDVHARVEGEDVVGLLVLVTGGEQRFVFVNLMGKIDPSSIGRIGKALDVPTLEDLDLDE